MVSCRWETDVWTLHEYIYSRSRLGPRIEKPESSRRTLPGVGRDKRKQSGVYALKVRRLSAGLSYVKRECRWFTYDEEVADLVPLWQKVGRSG